MINIVSFAHLLKKVDFNAIVDHLPLTHIIEGKVEPVTNRIKRLLEVLSSYSLNLYYINGKDIYTQWFSLRQKHYKSDPLLIWKKYYLLDITIYLRMNKRDIWTKWDLAKTHVTVLPKVHSVDKGVDPKVRPDKQITKPLGTPQSHSCWVKRSISC